MPKGICFSMKNKQVDAEVGFDWVKRVSDKCLLLKKKNQPIF